MVSNSKTSSASETKTTDARQVVDDQGIAVGGESVVNIHQVPDEAWELTGEVVGVLADVTRKKLAQDQADNTELFATVLKLGIPAAAIAFIMR